jgi:hypothetical protein
MTERQARELPATVAFKSDKNGVHSIVSGDTAAKQHRIPADDPMTIARVIQRMLAAGVQVSPYAFFCPAIDKAGEYIRQTDDKGNVILNKYGKARTAVIDLTKALKEVESGTREVKLAFGKFGTFRIDVMPVKEAKAEKPKTEYFDVAAFFTDTPKKK